MLPDGPRSDGELIASWLEYLHYLSIDRIGDVKRGEIDLIAFHTYYKQW